MKMLTFSKDKEGRGVIVGGWLFWLRQILYFSAAVLIVFAAGFFAFGQFIVGLILGGVAILFYFSAKQIFAFIYSIVNH